MDLYGRWFTVELYEQNPGGFVDVIKYRTTEMGAGDGIDVHSDGLTHTTAI